jgi:YHS domain-containing protein
MFKGGSISMKNIIYLVVSIFIFSIILVGCAKKEEYIPSSEKPEMTGAGPSGLETYFVDANIYPKPSAMDTTKSAKDEMVTCAYDKMQMKKSAMEAQMQYKGKTLYFCTKAEMEKFKKNPEGYLSGKVKPN